MKFMILWNFLCVYGMINLNFNVDFAKKSYVI